ncbi:hypothetical protein G9A89_008246 [Geosiphon pyriformis]|nr:hypothetical protein G9A89_008246 [Geosiphon pyriformis]
MRKAVKSVFLHRAPFSTKKNRDSKDLTFETIHFEKGISNKDFFPSSSSSEVDYEDDYQLSLRPPSPYDSRTVHSKRSSSSSSSSSLLANLTNAIKMSKNTKKEENGQYTYTGSLNNSPPTPNSSYSPTLVGTPPISTKETSSTSSRLTILTDSIPSTPVLSPSTPVTPTTPILAFNQCTFKSPVLTSSTKTQNLENSLKKNHLKHVIPSLPLTSNPPPLPHFAGTEPVDLHFIIKDRLFKIPDCTARTLYFLCAWIRDIVEPELEIKINPLLLELNIPRANLIQLTITNTFLSEEGGMKNIVTKYGITSQNPLKVELLGDMERSFSHSSEEDWPHLMECEGMITITPQLPDFVVDLFNCLSYKFEGNKKEMTPLNMSEEEYSEEESDPEIFTSVLDKLARRLGGNNLAVCNKKDGLISSFGAKFNFILAELHELTGTMPPADCCPWALRQGNSVTIIEKPSGQTAPPAIMQWLQYTIDFLCLLWDAERGTLFNPRTSRPYGSLQPELSALQLEGSFEHTIKVPRDFLQGSFMGSMLFKQQQDNGTAIITRRDVPLLTSFRPEKIFPRIYSAQDLLLQDADLDDLKSSDELTQFIPVFKSHWVVELQSPKLHMVRLGNLYKHCDDCSNYEGHTTSTADVRALVKHRTAFGGPYGAVIKRHGESDADRTELAFNPLNNCIHDDDPYVPLNNFKDDGYIVFGIGGPSSRDGGKVPSLKDLCRRVLITQGKLVETVPAPVVKCKERLCSGCQKWFFNPAETIILWMAAQDFYCGMLVIGHYCKYQCVPSQVRENIKNGNCAWERGT